jgi:hypothetical protein
MSETVTKLTDLSRPQMAMLLAADKSGGGGQEAELQRLALPFEGGTVPSNLHNHYSRASDALVSKGLFEKKVLGRETQFWLTQKAWDALGKTGEAPGPAQEGLF